jgi:hypothetical protein
MHSFNLKCLKCYNIVCSLVSAKAAKSLSVPPALATMDVGKFMDDNAS